MIETLIKLINYSMCNSKKRQSIAERFEVSTYKDLNPLHYSSCVEFINGWLFR